MTIKLKKLFKTDDEILLEFKQDIEHEIISKLYQTVKYIDSKLHRKLVEREILLGESVEIIPDYSGGFERLIKVSFEVKEKFLEKLKGEKIIKNYKLVVEEEFLPEKKTKKGAGDSLEIIYPSPSDEYDSAYLISATIKCYPQKVIDYYKKTEWEMREREFLKKGLLLVCNGLKFNPNSGRTSYGATKMTFKKYTALYKLLKYFLQNPNKEISKEDSLRVIHPEKRYQEIQQLSPYSQEVKNTINNIRKKLGMSGENKENEDLFEQTNGGYKLNC